MILASLRARLPLLVTLVAASQLIAAGALFAAGCSPDGHEDQGVVPSGPHAFFLNPTAWIDASHPEEPPYLTFSVRFSDPGQTPTTVSVKNVELFSEGGESLASFGGELTPSDLTFESGTTESAHISANTTNAALAGACGAKRVAATFHGAACECDFSAEKDVVIICQPDARAGDLLAEEGLPAPANKPCKLQRFSLDGDVKTLTEEHVYGYGENGKVRFIDVHDASDTHIERIVYSYTDAGYLSEERTVDVETAMATNVVTYSYGASGALAKRVVDGDSFLDGRADRTDSFTFDGNTWNESVLYPMQSPRSYSYSYDPVELTLTEGDGSVQFKEPLAGPNDFFALPSEVDGPKIAAGGGSAFTYDASERLVSIEGPSFLAVRDEYLYDCQ